LTRRWAARIAESYIPGLGDNAISMATEWFEPEFRRMLRRRLMIVAHSFGRMTLKYFDEVAGEQKGVVWDRFLGAVEEWLNNYSSTKSIYISRRYEQRARDVLTDAFREGLGEASTQKRLRSVLAGDIGVNAARRIARTETHTAASIGADEAADARDLDMMKEWASTEDARTRPDHSAANGQTVTYNEHFVVGGETLDFPGDPNGSAEQIINCRCVVLYHPIINGQVIK
jgi:Phage Mu protein F like protein